MKLAILHPAFESVGGAEILAATQASLLRDEGFHPEVVTQSFDPGNWAARLEGIPVHVVPKRHWTDLLAGGDRLRKLRRRGKRAAAALRDYDVVIAHNSPASAILGEATIRARKIWQCNEPPRGLHLREANPVLMARMDASSGWGQDAATREFQGALVAHDRSLSRASSLRARLDFDLEGCRHLDLIYAISEFSRDNARRIYGQCREEVIYPIVRFPEGVAHRAGLDRAVCKVLVHSRLEVLKNIDTVIRGFQRFAAASPVPCQLHVVGEGPSRSLLEALAGELCTPGMVKFHGYLPDGELQEVYAACDVFALVTLDEPFGMVYPEAAARGLLLVGPDHGGPLEILDGGRLGWAVDAFSPEALAQALEAIWALDDAEVDRRRAVADQACRSRFGKAAIAPQLKALLEC